MARKRVSLSVTVPQQIIDAIEQIWHDPKVISDYGRITGKELSKSKVVSAALAVALKDTQSIIQMLRLNKP